MCRTDLSNSNKTQRKDKRTVISERFKTARCNVRNMNHKETEQEKLMKNAKINKASTPETKTKLKGPKNWQIV
jgi:hypothetical protein